MEFFSEQLARAEMSYRRERRGGAQQWARTEGRGESVLPRRLRRRRPAPEGSR
ncbi:MAG: hypothetical protein ACTHJH_01010 [Marmoricola sp.]